MEKTDRCLQLWDECLRIFSQIIEPERFNVWFKPIRPLMIVDSQITIEVPNDFFREYLEENFLDIISKTLKRVIGSDARLQYLVRPTNSTRMVIPSSNHTAPINKPVPTNMGSLALSNPSAMAYPGLIKTEVDPRLNPVYNFGNLVMGDCNRMAITAGLNIAESPGRNSFNPLFLFGGSGLGKTHISQAIGLAIKEKHPDLVVLYVTGNEFKHEYVEATAVKNKLVDFMAKYNRMDVLIVDDIQELNGAQSTQNAFFNVFNHLHQTGKQLIFTSDRPASELQNFEDRLLSRFKWGLSVELLRPDYATRLAMLKSRSRREGVDIPESVLDFLAARVNSNFRELEGTLISLMAHATLAHQDITVELAEKITDKIIGEDRNEITMDRIKDIVCEYFNISQTDIESKSRKRQIAQARQIAMYFSRNCASNCSLANIGALYGGRDHATVLHACKTVMDLMSNDRSIRQYVSDIGRMLQPDEKLI